MGKEVGKGQAFNSEGVVRWAEGGIKAGDRLEQEAEQKKKKEKL